MSKITDCFVRDNFGGGYLPVYDTDPNVQVICATKNGIRSQSGKSAVNVPLLPFTDAEIEDRMVLMLLEAVKATGWKYKDAYQHAEDAFRAQGLDLYRILTSADHHLIPSGRRIAVADPEAVGRIIDGGTGHRGVALFNPGAVLGYKKLGRTCFDHILAGVLVFGE